MAQDFSQLYNDLKAELASLKDAKEKSATIIGTESHQLNLSWTLADTTYGFGLTSSKIKVVKLDNSSSKDFLMSLYNNTLEHVGLAYRTFSSGSIKRMSPGHYELRLLPTNTLVGDEVGSTVNCNFTLNTTSNVNVTVTEEANPYAA